MNTLLTPPEGRRRPPDEHQITQRADTPPSLSLPLSASPPPRITYLLTYLPDPRLAGFSLITLIT